MWKGCKRLKNPQWVWWYQEPAYVKGPIPRFVLWDSQECYKWIDRKRLKGAHDTCLRVRNFSLCLGRDFPNGLQQCERLKCSTSSPCAGVLLLKKVRPLPYQKSVFLFWYNCVFTPLLNLSHKPAEHQINHFSKVPEIGEFCKGHTALVTHISWVHLKTR